MKVFIILALALVARAEPPVPQDYSYDMSPPSVNAPSASYGLPNQQFGTPINTNNGLTDATFTGFGDNNQYDDMPSSEYGAPSMPSNQYLPASRTPSQQYGAPAQQQRTPSQQYGAPTQSRGSSARKPSQQYGAPAQQRTPSQQYGAPAQQRTPSQQYGAPAQQRTPSQQYGAPAQRTPSQQYGAPAQNRGNSARTPSQQYGASSSRTPSQQYGAPATRTPSQQYGTPSIRTPANRNAAARMPSQQYGAPSNMPSQEYGAPAFGGYPDSRDNSYDDMSEPASYEYKYEVNDGESGSEFGHKEERDGDATFGEYRVLLPDGRTQVVAYEADENGYRPTITYLEPENQGYPKSNGGPY